MLKNKLFEEDNKITIDDYIKDYFYIVYNAQELKDELKQDGAKWDYVRFRCYFEKDNYNYKKYDTYKVYIVNDKLTY